MKEILTALMIWLGANTPLDTNHDVPKILFLSQDKMEKLYYVQEQESNPNNKLHGLYDTDKDTILLLDTWDRRKPWDMGVLVHEMVHYLQDVNGIEFSCVNEMERDAWPIQKKYLKEMHDFEWNYDELWYFVISTCEDY